MGADKKSNPLTIDASALRLLQTVGLEDFEYYSAGKEKTVKESLQRWPLLRAVYHSLTAASRGRGAAISISTTAEVIDESENGPRGPVPLASGGDCQTSAPPSESEHS